MWYFVLNTWRINVFDCWVRQERLKCWGQVTMLTNFEKETFTFFTPLDIGTQSCTRNISIFMLLIEPPFKQRDDILNNFIKLLMFVLLVLITNICLPSHVLRIRSIQWWWTVFPIQVSNILDIGIYTGVKVFFIVIVCPWKVYSTDVWIEAPSQVPGWTIRAAL